MSSSDPARATDSAATAHADAPSPHADIDLLKLEAMPPRELLKWAFEHYGSRAAIGTSLQLTGSVLIDMCAKAGVPFRVFLIDTLRLHRESYDLIGTFEARYSIKIERFLPDPRRLDQMLAMHGEYLFFDSKAKQEYCCQIRKVEPNEKALSTLDAWVTGLRRDQSEARTATRRASFTHQSGRTILKLAPLADWTGEEVRAYIEKNKVPYHPLFERGYDSIGCIICTTPLRPGEPKRAGRWRWFNALDESKECGIHLEKGDGI
jgi:phosphoadenylyl-sulfate reductase (thioredoxin)